MTSNRLTWLACVIALLLPGIASPQGTGRSMDFDLSIPAAGMGGTSNAAFWSDIGYWSNPALLGYVRGVRYVHTRSRLVPGLPANVFLNSDAVEAGVAGVGAVFSGQPVHAGGVFLDYGPSEGVDENGNPTGTFGAFERVRSWGLGVSLMAAVEGVVRSTGHEVPGWSRYVDVSGGMNWKRVTIALAPAAALGTAEGSVQDWGVHARVTPLDGLDDRDRAPVRVDLAYGTSVLNYNDHLFVFTPSDEGSPATRHHRSGGALRLAVGRLAVTSESATSFGHTLLEGLTPLVSLSAAFDHAELGTGDAIDYETDGHGVEMTLANIVSGRRGEYEDLEGGVNGDTWGWGAGLPIGRLAGVHYDEAWWPQARNSGLPHVHRRQLSAWIDPLAIARLLGQRH